MTRALFITFFLATFQLVLAQTAMYVNSSNGLNLREGPGTSYKTIVNIPNGSRISVLSTQGDWAKVEYNGEEGYVSRQYVSSNPPKNNSSSTRSKSNNSSNANNAASRSRASSSGSNGRSWGLGVRLGDPSGVTAKKYLTGGRALEFNFGTTSYVGFDYRDDFYDQDKYEDYEYVSYRRRGAVSFQVHYLFQKDIRGAENLQWYWGFGGQIRSKSFQYEYRYRDYYGPGPGDYTWVYGADRGSDLDLAADILIGLEYHIPGAPLSIFADGNLMLEILDDPFVLAPQGGIGIRYNFE